MFLPLSCACCGALGVSLCPDCVAQLRPAGPLDAPPGVDRCVALVDYVGVGRDLVLALKYRDARALVTSVAGALAEAITTDVMWTGDQSGAPGPIVDVVTWAPTSRQRRRARGFDQAQLVARSLGRQVGRPTARLLVRDPGAPQTGRSRRERLEGPGFHTRRAVPPRVLVIDDVMTSGATLTAAARALRQAGATWIIAAAVAHTPSIAREAHEGAGRRA